MAKQQLSFSEMMQQMQTLQAQMREQAQARVEEIKEELDQIAEALDMDIAELLGIRVKPTAAATSGSKASTNDGGEESKAERKKLVAEIKKKYDGKTVLAMAENNGKEDVTIDAKKRGPLHQWIIDAYTNGTLERYISEENEVPGEVRPNDNAA